MTAFSRVASAFEPFAKPDDVGFKSSLLNDIIFAIPKIKEPLKAIVDVIDLKKAKEGNLTELWRNEEKYPALDNCKLVSNFTSVRSNGRLVDCAGHRVCRVGDGATFERWLV